MLNIILLLVVMNQNADAITCKTYYKALKIVVEVDHLQQTKTRGYKHTLIIKSGYNYYQESKKYSSSVSLQAGISIPDVVDFSAKASEAFSDAHSLTIAKKWSNYNETTIETDFNPKFAQLVREVKTTITINGRKGSVTEEKYIDSIPLDKLLSPSQLEERSKKWLYKKFRDDTSNINGAVYTAEKCQLPDRDKLLSIIQTCMGQGWICATAALDGLHTIDGCSKSDFKFLNTLGDKGAKILRYPENIDYVVISDTWPETWEDCEKNDYQWYWKDLRRSQRLMNNSEPLVTMAIKKFLPSIAMCIIHPWKMAKSYHSVDIEHSSLFNINMINIVKCEANEICIKSWNKNITNSDGKELGICKFTGPPQLPEISTTMCLLPGMIYSNFRKLQYIHTKIVDCAPNEICKRTADKDSSDFIGIGLGSCVPMESSLFPAIPYEK